MSRSALKVRRALLGPPRRRRRIADRRDIERVRELARQARVEPPRVVFAGETKAAIRKLEQNLQHHREPSLFEEAR